TCRQSQRSGCQRQLMHTTTEVDGLAELVQRGEELRTHGDWRGALEVQHEALERAERQLGESVGTAGIAQNLAVTYKYTGDFAAAEPLYQRALGIAEAAGEPRLAAVLCHNLGGLAHARGDFAEGVRWARRGIEVRESLGDDPLAL